MDLVLIAFVCLWAGYRWGRASEAARELERRFERENEEFLDRLRETAP
jgi:hypothetical protein